MPTTSARPRSRTGRLRDDVGATMVEYGLIIALIAVVAASGAAILGTSLAGAFDDAGRLAGHCDRDRGNSSETPAVDNVGGPQCHQ